MTSKNISDLRARLGLTQAKLGELVGVSWVTIHRWESGKSTPKSEVCLRKLRELLGSNEEESECNHKN